jgi:hypothetical protein
MRKKKNEVQYLPPATRMREAAWFNILIAGTWCDQRFHHATLPPFAVLPPCQKCGGGRRTVTLVNKSGCMEQKCPMYFVYPSTFPFPVEWLRTVNFGKRLPEHLHHTCECGLHTSTLCADWSEDA